MVQRASSQLVLSLACLACFVACGGGSSTTTPPKGSTPAVTLSSIATGLTTPLDVQSPGDGGDRLFVVEQGGKIRAVKAGSLLPTPFLDISSKVTLNGEMGLLGLAFHPSFATNRRFYVNYVRGSTSAPQTVIAEYRDAHHKPRPSRPRERTHPSNRQSARPNEPQGWSTGIWPRWLSLHRPWRWRRHRRSGRKRSRCHHTLGQGVAYRYRSHEFGTAIRHSCGQSFLSRWWRTGNLGVRISKPVALLLRCFEQPFVCWRRWPGSIRRSRHCAGRRKLRLEYHGRSPLFQPIFRMQRVRFNATHPRVQPFGRGGRHWRLRVSRQHHSRTCWVVCDG